MATRLWKCVPHYAILCNHMGCLQEHVPASIPRCQSPTVEFSQVVPVQQKAVGPPILISSAGLLPPSITNRYGRVIARSRVLGDEARNHPAKQLRILSLRARLLHTPFTYAVMVLLCVPARMIGYPRVFPWNIKLSMAAFDLDMEDSEIAK